VYPLIFLLLAGIFLAKSDTITEFFYPKSNFPAESTKVVIKDQNSSYVNLSFWVIIIGIYYFISSAAVVLSSLPYLQTKVSEGWFFTHDPFLPQVLILVMSLFCILQSDRIVEIIDGVKNRKP
jgi:hypothetical protein